MRIILDVHVDTREDIDELKGYVESLKRDVARRQYQGFPGAAVERGDNTVWISGVTLDA
jgi:hypothetical protein